MSIYAPPQGAWTSYTPTITASSGTFTTTSATCFYAQNGKLITYRMDITITTVGTASGSVIATLPVNASTTAGAAGAGREDNISGKALSVKLTAATTISMNNYDNTSPIAAGSICRIFGSYEAA